MVCGNLEKVGNFEEFPTSEKVGNFEILMFEVLYFHSDQKVP